MTLNCVKTETQTSNASCLGEYCSLIHTLDPHRDLFNNDQEVQNGNGKNKSDKVQKVEGRERAFSVIKRLLTASELERLEENGKLIHLRIPQRIRSFILRDVPNESIMMSRKEHRLAFLELIKAEDVSLSQSIEVTDRSFNEKDGSSSSRPRLERTRSLTNKGSTLNTVPTCEMCYHVYRLLSHTRCLLSDEFTSTPLGKIELEAFGLNELMYQSTQTKTKTPKKRNISSKKNDNVNTQSDIVLRLQSSESMHEAKHERKQNVIESKNMAHLSSSSLINTPTTKTNKNKKSDRTKMTGPKKKNSNIIPASIKNVSHKRNSNGTAEEDKSSTIFHYDAKTSFTYTVLQNQSESPSSIDNVSKRSHQQAYNMVVCHDIFDTQERMKIFLSSFIEQNPQCKVLLWNYPGQAFTTFLPTQSLNNEFHAKCLNKLLIHVGAEGTNEFDSRKPFYLLGHGHGGSVACSHVAKCKYIPGLRGICLINPLIFIDTHFASVMHDCRNVFSCSPETRPDLPLYFYSRFIFSQEYLQKVSTPLALNLYTAVHNPISVQGRISLCNGVLNNIDLRESIQQLNVPIISVHGNHSELVRPIHAASFLQGREPCSTIHRALDQKGMKTTVLVMTEGGHELLQEKKKMVLALIEELLTGYHDVKKSQRQNKKPMRVISSDSWGAIVHQSTKLNDPSNVNGGSQKQDERIEHREVNQGNKKVIKASNTERIRTTTQKEVNIVLDPQNPSFERQQNFVYKPGTGAIYPSCDEYVKPKEYMSWRLKRNKKRLSRFQKAAKIIQGSLRVYMAKTMIVRLKRQRSALNIQRCFRGMLGRRIFKELLKELWAAQLVQRAYRGAMGRRTSYYRRMSIQAQINIARVWRGHVARKLVNKIVTYRNVAAINLQSLWRRCMAIDLAKYMRGRKHGSTTIQRIYRGYRGRRKADMERDKYIFSKSQSMGIELGRQMLTEHKHHATRLQSELSILEKERTSLESKVDVITNDLNTFQQQAGKLEKTMHEISLVEAQKRNNIAAQHVLREKKVQLDGDFSRLLSKISDRKNQLKVFEERLSLLEKKKKQKTESLRKLERKLVAILEAQENELVAIQRRQDQKVETIAHTGVFPPNSNDRVSSNPEKAALVAREKKKTAKLMDSTETMMKFGFMSMAMTYFTSMNMVGAMKNISTTEIKELDEEVLKNNDLMKNIDQGNNDISTQSQSNVLKWDVDNVVQWLSAIYLVQYEDVFRDASIDGPFLCQLTDDDLKNALGIEHVLHRKKILFGINQLKNSVKSKISTSFMQEDDHPQQSQISVENKIGVDSVNPVIIENTNEMRPEASTVIKSSNLSISQLSKWIRNQKDGKIKESLRHIADKDFDESLTRVQFVEGVGTAYIKSVDEQVFHINKCDEHGNTLLHVAAQNGNMKIAMFLINKGANPNHQNKQGQTPGHFALSYQFYDFATWLFDPDGGKGNDLLTNIYGLGPYDGLTDE